MTSRSSRSSSAAQPFDSAKTILRHAGAAARPPAGIPGPVADVPSVDGSQTALDDWSHGAIVQRTNLLRRLVGPPGARVATLIAPAGSGKTTLLAQWGEAERRPVAFVNVVHADRDRTQLIADITRSIARALDGGPVADLVRRLGASEY